MTKPFRAPKLTLSSTNQLLPISLYRNPHCPYHTEDSLHESEGLTGYRPKCAHHNALQQGELTAFLLRQTNQPFAIGTSDPRPSRYANEDGLRGRRRSSDRHHPEGRKLSKTQHKVRDPRPLSHSSSPPKNKKRPPNPRNPNTRGTSGMRGEPHIGNKSKPHRTNPKPSRIERAQRECQVSFSRIYLD